MPDINLAMAPQIGDADKLQPTGVQSDTFQGHVQPAIDHNMSALSESLGHFNSNLEHYGLAMSRLDAQGAAQGAADKLVRDKEAEKAQKLADQATAIKSYNVYRNTTTNDQQLTDIQTGRTNYASNPYVADFAKKDLATNAAEELAKTLHEQEAAGQIPFGTRDFNAERYVIGEAAKVREKYGLDNDAVVGHAFAGHLEGIRKGAVAKQEHALGLATQEQNSSSVYNNLGRNFDATAGVQGADPQAVMDGIRKTIAEVDPAVGGGDYGIKNKQYDALTLQMLAKKAEDPNTAVMAAAALDAKRADVDGHDIGSMASNPALAAHVQHIREIATRTMDAEDGHNKTETIKAADIQAAQAGQMKQIGEGREKLTTDLGSPLKGMSPPERQKEAIAGAIKQIRDQNGGKPDYEKEMRLAQQNDIPHPEVTRGIESAVGTIGSTSVAPADQTKALIQASNLYKMASAQGPDWAAKSINKGTKEAIDAFDQLTGSGGMTPAAATARIGVVKAQVKKDPVDFTGQEKQQISVYARDNSVVNAGEIEAKIGDLAKTLVTYTGMDKDKAIEAAQTKVLAQYPSLNGARISTSLVAPEDYPHVTALLENTFEKYKQDFHADGITKSNQLTVHPDGQGKLIIIPSAGGTLSHVTRITPEMIKAQRDQTEASKFKALRDHAASTFGPPETSTTGQYGYNTSVAGMP